MIQIHTSFTKNLSLDVRYLNMDESKYLEDLSRIELNEKGFGKYGVENIEHCLFTLPDGEKLAMRIWAPREFLPEQQSEQGRVVVTEGEPGDEDKLPAVLEYLPYRKADWTAERDHQRHPWLASHGYVVMRVDIRGSGDSDGVYYDEYLQQEQDDCCSLLGKNIQDKCKKGCLHYDLVF